MLTSFLSLTSRLDCCNSQSSAPVAVTFDLLLRPGKRLRQTLPQGGSSVASELTPPRLASSSGKEKAEKNVTKVFTTFKKQTKKKHKSEN